MARGILLDGTIDMGWFQMRRCKVRDLAQTPSKLPGVFFCCRSIGVAGVDGPKTGCVEGLAGCVPRPSLGPITYKQEIAFLCVAQLERWARCLATRRRGAVLAAASVD